ncbi:tail terminator [Gordonia phage Yikes]|uniref:Tail terminator n=1 Tax=Gordonia phage Yikes TaxID=2656545 RepID=A0A649VFA3_9CAUD|nr:tail terminator [Gordonia phage Yikes]QGJ91011.1 tail terminator [Gordonia phage Yikes]
MIEALYDLLVNDGDLADEGFDDESIFPNFTIHNEGPITSPRDKMFITVKYGEQAVRSNVMRRGPEVIQFNVHRPVELGPDYRAIRDVLDIIIAIMAEAESFTFQKYRITNTRFMGLGADLRDPGFNTFTKGVGFEILSHRVG